MKGVFKIFIQTTNTERNFLEVTGFCVDNNGHILTAAHGFNSLNKNDISKIEFNVF